MSEARQNFERWFEDYAVGQTEEGRTRTITSEDIGVFAELTGDDHPAHTDERFAVDRFGGLLAHGALTFSVVVGLTVEHNPRAVAYGYDRIRFPRPVVAGDVVTASSEVVEVGDHKNPSIGLVTKQYTATNQREETVLVCRHVLAVDRSDEGEDR